MILVNTIHGNNNYIVFISKSSLVSKSFERNRTSIVMVTKEFRDNSIAFYQIASPLRINHTKFCRKDMSLTWRAAVKSSLDLYEKCEFKKIYEYNNANDNISGIPCHYKILDLQFICIFLGNTVFNFILNKLPKKSVIVTLLNYLNLFSLSCLKNILTIDHTFRLRYLILS